MIIRATHCINKGAMPTKYKYILVDEFQDISTTRMNFLKAIISNNPDTILTAVGDDWQSIYRFNGSRLELITKFEKYLGTHTITKLEKTFRYNSSIAETAGKFIMQNDNQFKKDIKAHELVENSKVFLHDNYIDNESPSATDIRVLQIVKDIKERDPDSSIAILFRINSIKTPVEELLIQEGYNDIQYWTFHSSKDLEADYCIIIGLIDNKYKGFPNYYENPKVLEALLPELDGYKYSEERRLFYVAITRAKKECHLISDVTCPSAFVVEMITDNYNLNIKWTLGSE